MHYGFHSSPTCTFKSRTQVVTKQNQSGSSPGPGDYSPIKPLKRSGNHAYSKSSRQLYSSQLQTPGPGSYISNQYKLGGNKYSLRKKFIEKPSTTPSPLEYDNDTLKVKNKNPGYSMSTKSMSYDHLLIKQNNYKPGPQKYQKKSQFENQKTKIFIGTDKRKPLDLNQKTPGPAAYQNADSMMKTFSKSGFFKMNQQSKKPFYQSFDNPQKTPGPALYRSISQFEQNQKKKKGFSCRNKIKDIALSQISKVPGPGQYQSATLVNKSTAPQFSTSHKKRQSFIDTTVKEKKIVPSPGKHDLNFLSTKYKSTSCFNFSKAQRKSLYQNQVTPSPLVYNNEKLNLLNTSPKFSVGKDSTRYKNPQKMLMTARNPGPGQYDPNQKLTKSQSMLTKVGKQKRPDFESARFTPGPGYYNLRGKQQGPKWGFPQNKKVSYTDQKNQMKNGTFYETRSSFPDAPKYMNTNPKIVYKQQLKTSK